MFALTIRKGNLISFIGILFIFQVQAVELNSFRIQNISNKEYFLSWCLPNSNELLLFEVQSSSNGIDFETIAQVDNGKVFDNCMYYCFTDTKPFSGKSFYRLKILTTAMGFYFSKIESVYLGKDAALNHQLRCEKKDQYLTFFFSNLNFYGQAHVSLFDYFGIELFSQPAFFSNKQSLSLSNLATIPAGTYYLRLDTPKGSVVKKLILQ